MIWKLIFLASYPPVLGIAGYVIETFFEGISLVFCLYSHLHS